MNPRDKLIRIKEVEEMFGVSRHQAKRMCLKTRKHYNKQRGEPITLVQLRKANRLDE